MIRYYIVFIFLFSFGADAEGIRLENKNTIHGCNYSNDDFFKKSVPKDRVFTENELLWNIHLVGEKLYKYLKEKTSVYYYYRKEIDRSPVTYLDILQFDFNGERADFYALVRGDDLNISAFCYEGKYSSSLVNNFFPKEMIDGLKLEGDGDFYLIDNYTNNVVKIVKIKNEIINIYVYFEIDGVNI